MLLCNMKSEFLSLVFQAFYDITQCILPDIIHLIQSCILLSRQAGLLIDPKFLAQSCLECFVLTMPLFPEYHPSLSSCMVPIL